MSADFHRNPRVHCLAPTSDEDSIAAFYNGIDVLTHSSRIGESFGNVIAEAMAAGKPVIVNSTPLSDNAQVELVDNNKTGYVVRSLHGFKTALKALALDSGLRLRLGQGGRSKCLNYYDARHVSKDLLTTYREVIDGGHNRCLTLRQLKGWRDEYVRRELDIFDNATAVNNVYIFLEHTLFQSKLVRTHLASGRRMLQKRLLKTPLITH